MQIKELAQVPAVVQWEAAVQQLVIPGHPQTRGQWGQIPQLEPAPALELIPQLRAVAIPLHNFFFK